MTCCLYCVRRSTCWRCHKCHHFPRRRSSCHLKFPPGRNLSQSIRCSSPWVDITIVRATKSLIDFNEENVSSITNHADQPLHLQFAIEVDGILAQHQNCI